MWSLCNAVPPLFVAIVLRGQRPEKVVFHTDRGTQYASAQMTKFATENGITRSMGLTVICWDAMAESFFATLKTEFYYRRVWATRARAKTEVGAWIEDRYNRRRRHTPIGQISPVAFELQYSNQTAADQKAAYPRVHETGSRPVTDASTTTRSSPPITGRTSGVHDDAYGRRFALPP